MGHARLRIAPWIFQATRHVLTARIQRPNLSPQRAPSTHDRKCLLLPAPDPALAARGHIRWTQARSSPTQHYDPRHSRVCRCKRCLLQRTPLVLGRRHCSSTWIGLLRPLWRWRSLMLRRKKLRQHLPTALSLRDTPDHRAPPRQSRRALPRSPPYAMSHHRHRFQFHLQRRYHPDRRPSSRNFPNRELSERRAMAQVRQPRRQQPPSSQKANRLLPSPAARRRAKGRCRQRSKCSQLPARRPRPPRPASRRANFRSLHGRKLGRLLVR